MSLRIESTSNQYGPWVSSSAMVQVLARSSRVTTEDAAGRAWEVADDEVAVFDAVVEPSSGHAASRPPRVPEPPSDSARRLLTRRRLRRTSSFIGPPLVAHPRT